MEFDINPRRMLFLGKIKGDFEGRGPYAIIDRDIDNEGAYMYGVHFDFLLGYITALHNPNEKANIEIYNGIPRNNIIRKEFKEGLELECLSNEELKEINKQAFTAFGRQSPIEIS